MIQKIQIISNNICYGPPPEYGEEIEQHFTVSANGRIWFNGYNYVGGFEYYQKGRSVQISIGKENAKIILDLIEEYIKSDIIIMATDCGSWSIKITDTDGGIMTRDGSLIEEIYARDIPVSKTIRSIVPINNMFLFDGNYTDKDEE